MSEWSHLPNALHIDRLIALTPHLDSQELKYDVASVHEAEWHNTFTTLFNATRYDAYLAARRAALRTVRSSNQTEMYVRVRDAIMALVAYDDCGYMLREKPEHVQLLAALDVPGAALIFPVCGILPEEDPPA